LSITELEIHPAADIFPLDAETIDELAADIKEYGQQVYIETLDGKIIDGRRRYLACCKISLTPKIRAVTVADPIAHVVSLNLHRRHLTPGQRAMAAAKAKELGDKLREEAKERQTAAAASGGRSSGATRRGETKVPAQVPEPLGGDTRDKIGTLFGVGGRSVDYAANVLELAEPEIIQAVEEGHMGVRTAAALATESPEKQREEAAKPRPQRKGKAKDKAKENTNGDAPARDKGEEEQPREIKGVGVFRAQEAVNALTRIPKNDPLRKRGFQIVTDWIKANK